MQVSDSTWFSGRPASQYGTRQIVFSRKSRPGGSQASGNPVGARAATNDLELEDYEKLFTKRTILAGSREVTPATGTLPLYRRLLGHAYEALPPPLQAMHDMSGEMGAKGIATATRGKGLLARLLAAVIGFPQGGDNVPVRVAFVAERGRERWTRTFAGRSFHSTQEQGRGRFEWLPCERFGPVNAGMALVVDNGKLRLIVRRWSVLGIPLPVTLAPRGDSYEYAEDGRFHFHVEIGVPLVGLIVSYRGWLVPK